MERYIGLDVHAASSTLAVIGESGRRLQTHVLETNGRAPVEAILRPELQRSGHEPRGLGDDPVRRLDPLTDCPQRPR